MADYFTSFSLVVPLPDEAAQQYAVQLAQTMSDAGQDDPLPEHIPQCIREEQENWTFESVPASEPYGIWLHSEFGGIDAVCAFIQHLLHKFTPNGRVTFEWSHDCSKPLTDAYGGGAAIITADEIKTMSTSEWLQKNAA
jgi:hypothetical protein